ncbi:MAG: SRPBCC domain-containing protein [Flavisolibacter sp.]
MQQKRLIREEITIHALTSKVWNVLICPEYTRQYLFEGDVISEWTKGSPIVYQSEIDGKSQIIKKGSIEEVIPGLALKFSLSDLQETNNNHAIVTYELFPEEGGINLRMTQEILLPNPELYNIIVDNWKMVLKKIKWLAEYS